MNKKRFLLSFAMFSVLALTSCGGDKHTHTFGQEWEYDLTNHWHECECGEKADLTAHDWGEGEVTTSPTCTTQGLRTYTCECGATKEEPIQATGHRADTEWQSGDGYHWHNCLNDNCFEELDKAACTYVEDTDKRIESTCTTQGYKYSYCSVCEDEKVERLPLAAHQYGAEPISKVEPTCDTTGLYTYKCVNCTATREEVIDALDHDWQNKANEGEAFQYDSVGTWEQCSRCDATRNEVVTTTAPWAAFDLDNKDYITVKQDLTAWNDVTHTLTTKEYELDKGVWFDLADIVKSDDTTNRLVIEVTATVTGEVSYGAQGCFSVLDYSGEKIGYADILKTNARLDIQEYEKCKITALENGEEVNSISQQGAVFTYRFDFRYGNAIPKTLVINGANGGGGQDKPDIVEIKSIVAKETLCGHKSSCVEQGEKVDSTCTVLGYTSYVCKHADCDNAEYKIYETELAAHQPTTQTGAEVAKGYDWAGEASVCSVCGKILDDTNVIPAPWAHADIFSGDGSNFVSELNKSTFNLTTKTWTTTECDYLSIKPAVGDKFEDFATRKYVQLTMTATVQGGGWGGGMFDFYYGVNRNATGKIVTRNNSLIALGTTQSWENYAAIKEFVKDEDGSDLSGKPFKDIKVRVTLDASSVTELTNVWIGTSLANVSVVIHDITFKDKLCEHTNVEEVYNGMGYSEVCTECGRKVNYVNSLEVSADDGYMTKEENVTFDEREGCLKLTTLNHTSIPANSIYPVNFKMYYRGLVANARATGKTKIELHVYVESSSNDNRRFGWGVGNNLSAAQADHYNTPVKLQGDNNVAENSVITDESGVDAKLPANCWRVITVDVSGDYYADKADFFIVTPFVFGGNITNYPLSVYVSSIRCYAPTVE